MFFKLNQIMIRMEINLNTIGMEKGRQYETIITTKNSDNTYNAAPIGVICSGKDKIVNRIFKGSHTLENIISNREYFVNITQDPEIFMLSTLGNLPQNYFTSEGHLKCCDSYFKCKVVSLTEAVKQSDPIKKKGEAIVIKSEVTEITANNDKTAFNRGFGYVVESLSNYSRFELVDLDKKEEYIKTFKEAYRIVKKVGTKNDIASMKKIKEEYNKKGFKP